MSKKRKANKQSAAPAHSTADKTTYSRVEVAIWCNEVCMKLRAYAHGRLNTAERAEAFELAENAALWAQWCYKAPVSEFNAQCAYWAQCEQ